MRPIWKIVLPILVLLAAIAGTAALIALRPEAERAPVSLTPPLATTLRVEPQRRRVDAATQGTLRPRAITPLSAEVGGLVVERSSRLEEGLLVEAGTELLRIDEADYRAAVANAKAEIAGLERQLAEERAAAELAREEWSALGAGEPGPLVLREPQLEALEAQLAAAEARLARAERDLARTVVQAPISGRVTGKQVELGQRVAPGQELLRLEAAGAMEVVLPVSLEQLRFLELPLRGQQLEDGPAVALRGEVAGRAVAWRGRVLRTLAGLDPRTRMLRAVALVEEDAGGPPLLAGLYVEADIAGREIDGVVALPSAAVQPGDLCFVVVPAEEEEGHVLEARALEVLRRDRDQVLATGDLAAGDRVVTLRLPQMRAGMRVRLAEEEQDEGTDGDGADEAADDAEPSP